MKLFQGFFNKIYRLCAYYNTHKQLCRENLLFGMSDMLANRVSELVGGLLGLIPTKYQLNNISSSVGSKQ